MNETPNPEEAADLLVRGSVLAAAVKDADSGRRKIYLLWAAVIPLAMMGFDLFGSGGAGALAMPPFLLIGIVGTFLIVRQQTVTDMNAMKSYLAVIIIFAFGWPVLTWFVGPWLSDRLSFGWFATGLVGSCIFLGGYIWDRSRA